MKTKLVAAALVLMATLFISSVAGAQNTEGANSDQPNNEAAKETKDDGVVRGRVSSVTAYRGQAMVTREVSVGEGTGLQEVVVTGMPERILPESLFADGGEGLEVRAVYLRQRVVGERVSEALSEELRGWSESLQAVDKLIRQNQSDTSLLTTQTQFLTSLEQFAANVTLKERESGILNAEELSRLADLIFEKRKALNDRRFQLTEDARDLQERRQHLVNQLNMYGSRGTRISREAVVFFDKNNAAATTINLHYLVGGVDWRPTYTLRAETGSQDFELEYTAMITQTSGENWEDVELTLSTASPALIAQGVSLEPLKVSLEFNNGNNDGRGPNAELTEGKVLEEYRRLRSAQLETARGGSKSRSQARDAAELYEAERTANQDIQTELNSLANELQRLEFAEGNRLEILGGSATEGIAVEYRLKGTHGIASRRDQQFIGIADHAVTGEFAYVATPALSDFVYLQADVKNVTDSVLLDGPYTAYLDGRFVGRAALPMVARGESFTVGFGIDEQLRVGRKLEEKEEAMQGGNRVTTYKYRITLFNYKQDAVKMLVYDRIPVAMGSQLRVNMDADATTPLSTDRTYVKQQKPEGILRWDVEVPGGSSGVDAAEITYAYTMEYDRQMRIVIPNQ